MKCIHVVHVHAYMCSTSFLIVIFHSGHNSIVYAQMDNVRVHVLLYSVHACMCMYMRPGAHDQAICFSVHMSAMFTMATLPERCPVEGGDRIRRAG